MWDLGKAQPIPRQDVALNIAEVSQRWQPRPLWWWEKLTPPAPTQPSRCPQFCYPVPRCFPRSMVILRQVLRQLATQNTDQTSGWMVRPQIDRARFRNISNLYLVEPNRIRNAIHKLLTLNMSPGINSLSPTSRESSVVLPACRLWSRKGGCRCYKEVTAITADQCHVQVEGVCRLQLVILYWILHYIITSYTNAAQSKNVPKPNWSDVRPERSRMRTWTYSNTRSDQQW